MSEFKTPDLIQFTKKEKLSSPGILGSDEANVSLQVTPVIEEGQGEASKQNKEVFTTPPAHVIKEPSSTKKHEPKPLRPEELILQKEKYDKILSSLKYREPLGSSPADSRYSFEVLKTGAIVDQVNFKEKAYFIVGRVPGCDIIAENPTVSRLHAVLQFIDGNYKKVIDGSEAEKSDSNDDSDHEEKETQVREKGLYLYDLGSTHGTFMNKNRVFPNRFYRLRVGHVIKFGNSARLYVVCGPDEDEEEESEKTVTELMREKLQKELERKKIREKMEEEGSGPPERNVEEEGISWGMGEDAEEETDLRENPFSVDFESTELNLNDPKKSLRSWFEREGYDLEYDVREKAAGHFICRVDLPIDGAGDNKIFAEVEVKGKKKEAVAQCAVQACKILDKYGVLRQSNKESRVKRKHRDWEDQDYYSSDEDIFLDRTGTVEKKREKRMREAGKIQQQIETYDSLLEKDKTFQAEIDALKLKIEKSERKLEEDNDDVDPLDAFMSDLKTGSSDLKKLKARVRELVADQSKNKKLLDIAKPAIPHPSIKPTPPLSNVNIESASASLFAKSPAPSAATSAMDTEILEVSSETDASQPIPVRKSDPPLFGPRVQFKVASKPKLQSLIKPLVSKSPKDGIETKKNDSTPSKSIVEEDEEENEAEEDDSNLSDEDSLSLSHKDRNKNLGEKSTRTSSSGSGDSKNLDVVSDKDMSHTEATDETLMNDAEEGTADSETKQLKSKKPRHRDRNKKKEVKYDYDAEDPDYSIWVPPVGQKGDGRTSLNEKLGY